MADVNINKFRASVVRDGSKPASPGFIVSEGQDPVNPPGTNNYVPYSGATANVELGEYGVEAGFITLDTTPTNTPTDQGTIFWDADDETVDIVLNGYTMKIGEDLFYPVKNQTGSTIAKGVAVRFNGTVGASGRLLIAPFIADGSVPSSRFMGVTAEEILNGEDGKVLYFGRVRGINTNAFNEGDILYASTTVAGGYQTAIPVAPNNIVQVAAVVTKSATVGTIFVRPTLGSNINKDEGVKIVSVADKNLLQYQSGTSLWENKSLAQVIGGTSSQFVKGDGSLDSTSYGTGTVTSVGLSSATSGVTIGSSPVTTSGTITLAIATASGSQNGLLSSTDWTTFNNKIAGTIATGQVAFGTAANTVGGDAGFTWDNTNKRLGIGATSTNALTVLGTSQFIGSAATNNITINPTISTSSYVNTISHTNLGLEFNNNSASRGYAWSVNSVLRWTIISNGVLESNGAQTIQTSTGNLILTSADNTGIVDIRRNNRALGAELRISNSAVSGAWVAGDIVGTLNFYLPNDTSTTQPIRSQIQAISSVGASYPASMNLTFSTANGNTLTEGFRLTSLSNLLVGTTTDNGARLQVSGTSTFSNIITANSDIHQVSTGGLYWGAASTYVIGVTGNTANGNLSFITGSTVKATITSSGNVGIGTSSPSQALDIYRDSSVASYVVARNGSGVQTAIGVAGDNGSLLGTLSNHNLRIVTNGAVVATITNTGFVSAGATTNGRLGVRGFTNDSSGYAFEAANASGNTLFITRNDGISTFTGNVGIGTFSPINGGGNSKWITLDGNSYGGGFISSVGGTAKGYLYYDDGTATFAIQAASSVGVSFLTSNTERARITSGGNFLIGTTTDAGFKLDVNGTSRSSVAYKFGTYTQGSTTPNVSNVSIMIIANSSPTTITNFTNAVAGQVLTLGFSDSNTTINRANTYLLNGNNYTSGPNDFLQLVFDGTYWFEISRSSNA